MEYRALEHQKSCKNFAGCITYQLKSLNKKFRRLGREAKSLTSSFMGKRFFDVRIMLEATLLMEERMHME
jgi:hypothetical protein